jgi:sulfide:quinone oxidoreductase
MPKQAHMADLQARTAARNLAAEFAGREPTETFKVELICIVDTNDSGMLVMRNEKYNFVLPSMRLFHLLKRLFEWLYLRKFR